MGEDIYGLMAGLDDADDLFDTVVNLTANSFVTDLAEAVTQDWGLNLSMPDSLSGFDGNNMTGDEIVRRTTAWLKLKGSYPTA